VAGKYSWEDHKCSPVCTVKTGGGDCYGYDGFPVSKNTNVHRGQKYNIRDEYYKNTYNVGADGYGVSCIIVSGSSNCRITFYNSRGSRACTIGPGTHDYPSVGGCGNDNVWSYELKTAAAADEALGEAEAFQEPTAEAAFSDSLAVKALAVVGGVATLYLLHQAYTKKNAEYSPV